MNEAVKNFIDEDPDRQPIAGKRIVKVIWNGASDCAMVSYDFSQFPNPKFLSTMFRTLADEIDADLKRQGDFNFNQNMMKVMHDAQLKAQLTADHAAQSAQVVNARLKNMRG
jgi:hypothetical protein